MTARPRSSQEHDLRLELVTLVNTTVEAALAGQAAALYANAAREPDLSEPGLVVWAALRFLGLQRIAHTVGDAVTDHEERCHHSKAAVRSLLADLVSELEADGKLRERLGRALWT